MKHVPNLAIGVLESIQATTPNFNPPAPRSHHASSVIGWAVVALLALLVLAAAGAQGA